MPVNSLKALGVCWMLVITSVKAHDLNGFLGAGYTAVNLAEAAGRPEGELEQWDQFHYQIALQYAPFQLGRGALGLEVAYQQLYYYYYESPFGSQVARGENYAETTSLQVFFQGALGTKAFYQLGVGPHLFDDGVALGVFGAAGLRILITDKMSLPVGLRTDFVTGDGLPTPIKLVLGVMTHI